MVLKATPSKAVPTTRLSKVVNKDSLHYTFFFLFFFFAMETDIRMKRASKSMAILSGTLNGGSSLRQRRMLEGLDKRK